jgi:hypothetical protein
LKKLVGDMDELQVETASMKPAQVYSQLRTNRDANESVYEIAITHVSLRSEPGVPVATLQEQNHWLVGYNYTKGLIDLVLFRRWVSFDTTSTEPFYPGDFASDVVKNGFRLLELPPYANNYFFLLFATARKQIDLRFTDEYSHKSDLWGCKGRCSGRSQDGQA